MKTKDIFHIEPAADSGNAFMLTGPVASIRLTGENKIVGTIYRSFRNVQGAVPGVPVWWFCPKEPPTPAEHSDVSEADIIRKALAWLASHPDSYKD